MAKRDRTASGAAIAGTGGVVGTVGLAGGGLPGTKAKRTLKDVKDASGRRTKAAEFTRAYRGGEFGYRQNAHHTFKTFGLGGGREGESRGAHFAHGQKAGAIKSEDKILRHLKVARRGSNAALLGGAGLVAYGVHRAKTPVNKADSDRKLKGYSGAALGVGGTAAAASAGGARVLEHQGRKWASGAAADYEAAGKIVPKMGGYRVNPYPQKIKNKRVPDIAPEKTDKLIGNTEKKSMAGKSRAQVHAAGTLRGSAAQGRYFAGTYGSMAHYARKVRGPALGVAAAGAGGLALANRDKLKKSYGPTSYSSRMSAFGIEH